MSPRSQGVGYVLGLRARVRLGHGCAVACAHTPVQSRHMYAEPQKKKVPSYVVVRPGYTQL